MLIIFPRSELDSQAYQIRAPDWTKRIISQILLQILKQILTHSNYKDAYTQMYIFFKLGHKDTIKIYAQRRKIMNRNGPKLPYKYL